MDVNKNSYTIGFATIMVIIVAALLSSAAIGLKPFQSKNIKQEKKQNILKSVGVEVSREQAEIDYPIYIKEELVVNHLGELQEGYAFNVDLSKELRKNAHDKLMASLGAKDNAILIAGNGYSFKGEKWRSSKLFDRFRLVQNDNIEKYQTGKLVFNLPNSKTSGYALVLLSGKLLYKVSVMGKGWSDPIVQRKPKKVPQKSATF